MCPPLPAVVKIRQRSAQPDMDVEGRGARARVEALAQMLDAEAIELRAVGEGSAFAQIRGFSEVYVDECVGGFVQCGGDDRVERVGVVLVGGGRWGW